MTPSPPVPATARPAVAAGQRLLRHGRPTLVASAAALAVAILGGLLTDIGPWYLTLQQPPWKPPDWAFGPIWTTIFILAATAGVIGWRRAPSAAAGQRLMLAFAANAALNVFWSLLFFRLHRPDWALLEVPLLWLSVLVIIVLLWRIARLAALLLLPYLVWVSIASVLNGAVVRLNGPFGAA